MKAEDIGRFIREKRTTLALSQNDLAQAVNVSVKTVSKWETGNGYPNIGVVQDLAKALHCTTDELLNGSAFPEVRDARLDYENTNNPLQHTEFFGIWIVKPFHTLQNDIKTNRVFSAYITDKETQQTVLTLTDCVCCWEGIRGWDGIVDGDIVLVTASYKQYIIKKARYEVQCKAEA